MSIISGFNHQKPGDNKKPMIYNDGDSTYVLNRTIGADGNPVYYGVGPLGRYVEFSTDGVKTETIPSITITPYLDSGRKYLAIKNNSNYDVVLGSDVANIRYDDADHPYLTCFISRIEEPNFALVGFGVSNDHMVFINFRASDVVPANSSVNARVNAEKQYDLSSLVV